MFKSIFKKETIEISSRTIAVCTLTLFGQARFKVMIQLALGDYKLLENLGCDTNEQISQYLQGFLEQLYSEQYDGDIEKFRVKLETPEAVTGLLWELVNKNLLENEANWLSNKKSQNQARG